MMLLVQVISTSVIVFIGFFYAWYRPRIKSEKNQTRFIYVMGVLFFLVLIINLIFFNDKDLYV